MTVPQPDFDGDLAAGKLREDAFGRVLLAAREMWEHKRDFQCVRTGNLAIEYRTSAEPNGAGERRLSGISVTRSHWYVLEYAHERRLVVPTEYVKELTRAAIRQKKFVWGGDHGRFQNALVPVDWFLRGAPA